MVKTDKTNQSKDSNVAYFQLMTKINSSTVQSTSNSETTEKFEEKLKIQ